MTRLRSHSMLTGLSPKQCSITVQLHNLILGKFVNLHAEGIEELYKAHTSEINFILKLRIKGTDLGATLLWGLIQTRHNPAKYVKVKKFVRQIALGHKTIKGSPIATVIDFINTHPPYGPCAYTRKMFGLILHAIRCHLKGKPLPKLVVSKSAVRWAENLNMNNVLHILRV